MTIETESRFVRDVFVGADPYPMYVQEWAGPGRDTGSRPPVVLIHGGSHSGVMWTTEPSGAPGWARRLAARGWRCFVVDWPGTGRSGCAPEALPGLSIDHVAAAHVALLDRIGPALLVGHSIGASVAYKTAEAASDSVRAIAALASSPTPNGGAAEQTVPAADPERPVRSNRAVMEQRLCSSDRFPEDCQDAYHASLVPYGPRLRNGALGVGQNGEDEDFRIHDVAAVRRVPILFLTVDDDRVSPASVSAKTADALGAQVVSLDRDWGLPGFGHMFPIETGNEAILDRVEGWLLERVDAAPGRP